MSAIRLISLELIFPTFSSNLMSGKHSQSKVDPDLSIRLAPLVMAGQLNAAQREAWAVFKSRMVGAYSLSEDLDGHKLADALFGSGGATSPYLPEGERRGYLNLLKGLYTLYRNPVVHNEAQLSPDEADAILTLVNAALVRLADLRDQEEHTPRTS